MKIRSASGSDSPLSSLPRKLQMERVDTCICWRWMRNSSVTFLSKCFQRALASLPMLLEGGQLSSFPKWREGCPT